MALPSSGKISISDILKEMGKSPTAKADLNDLAAQWYTNTKKAKFNKTTHSLSDWYGERWWGFGSAIVNPSFISVPGTGGNYTIRITSDTSWTVSVGNPFISVSSTSGFGSMNLGVTVRRSTWPSARSSWVKVQTGGQTGTVTVNQAAGDDAPPPGGGGTPQK